MARAGSLIAFDPPEHTRFALVVHAGVHGTGVHHCLGAPLARMEMRIAFPALRRRFPASRWPIRTNRSSSGPSAWAVSLCPSGALRIVAG